MTTTLSIPEFKHLLEKTNLKVFLWVHNIARSTHEYIPIDAKHYGAINGFKKEETVELQTEDGCIFINKFNPCATLSA